MASVALSEKWANKMFELLGKDETKEKGKIKMELARMTTSLEAVEKKLDKLLESYLEEIVDTEGYQTKKNQLLQQKLIFKEKIEEIKTKGSNWLEPMREFLNVAADAAKIVRRKNNCHDLAIVAKKVGSNFLLMNKRIEFCPNPPHNALAARPFAARANPSDLLMCRGEDSNLRSPFGREIYSLVHLTALPPRLTNFLIIDLSFKDFRYLSHLTASALVSNSSK